jgi:hypothetical protein
MSLLDEMVAHLRIGPTDLMRIIETAPARYKEYTIPKRRGGQRLIAQPSRELKALQRYILEFKLSAFPIHEAATGYVKGRNIHFNAEMHRHNRVILKLDFQDFFPTITVRDWNLLLRARRPDVIDPGDLNLYRLLLFWGQRSRIPRCLSIGAPTSPTLSNIIMFELDTRFANVARTSKVTYTRYADDMTISGASVEHVRQFEEDIIKIVRSTKSPALTFNQQKRGVYLKGEKRMVTGLIITPESRLSIGRERKRLISVMLHKVVIGESAGVEHFNYLKGIIGFCIANEPEFVGRMRTKYGSDVVDRVLQFTPP